MTRAGVQISFGVVLGSVIFVLHEQTDWRAQSHTMLSTRLDVNEILLVSLWVVHDQIKAL